MKRTYHLHPAPSRKHARTGLWVMEGRKAYIYDAFKNKLDKDIGRWSVIRTKYVIRTWHNAILQWNASSEASETQLKTFLKMIERCDRIQLYRSGDETTAVSAEWQEATSQCKGIWSDTSKFSSIKEREQCLILHRQCNKTQPIIQILVMWSHRFFALEQQWSLSKERML